MGNSNSKWRNVDAQNYLSFVAELFGNPYIYVDKPYGMAIWIQKNLKNKTIFNSRVCFDKIIVKDEHTSFVYICVKTNISSDISGKISGISNSFGYDSLKKSLWARCDSIDGSILQLFLATNIALRKNTPKELMSKCIHNVRKCYHLLCENLDELNSDELNPKSIENFTPWYASNQPLEIRLGEQNDAQYYRTIDEYMDSKNVSKSPLAFPSAPGAKPTIENFNNISKNKDCRGACDRRYKKLSRENLINYNAYNSFQKKKSP